MMGTSSADLTICPHNTQDGQMSMTTSVTQAKAVATGPPRAATRLARHGDLIARWSGQGKCQIWAFWGQRRSEHYLHRFPTSKLHRRATLKQTHRRRKSSRKKSLPPTPRTSPPWRPREIWTGHHPPHLLNQKIGRIRPGGAEDKHESWDES
jgi:hypothetical protein